MKKVLLTGGGTAGHVTANLALMPFLHKEGYEIYYIGRKEGIEKELVEDVEDCKVTYFGISSGKLRRQINIENIKDFFKVGKGYFEALKLLKKIKPDLVFSKGGYVVVPVILSAKSLNIPIIIHESDYTPGLANKIAMPFAKVILTSFESTKNFIKKGEVIHTGSPIRDEILEGNFEIGKTFVGFKDDKKVLLLTGGSQGAKKLNETLRNALKEGKLQDFNIIHLAGKGNLDTSLDYTNYKQFEYLSTELPHIFAYADFVITRGGSNSIFELLALKKPHIIIPLPKGASRGDQLENAKEFFEKGYSKVLYENDLTTNSLKLNLQDLCINKDEYVKNMNSYTKNNTLNEIMSLIKKNID
ncbi:MAG: undecaprenyldiphospho-muramoylpentapeptide beta-N-acetylglucosaminyltransferase [Lachnospirales bacterium]